MGNAGRLDIHTEALAQPAQFSSVERVEREKKNRKYRTGHVTYLCI